MAADALLVGRALTLMHQYLMQIEKLALDGGAPRLLSRSAAVTAAMATPSKRKWNRIVDSKNGKII